RSSSLIRAASGTWFSSKRAWALTRSGEDWSATKRWRMRRRKLRKRPRPSSAVRIQSSSSSERKKPWGRASARAAGGARARREGSAGRQYAAIRRLSSERRAGSPGFCTARMEAQAVVGKASLREVASDMGWVLRRLSPNASAKGDNQPPELRLHEDRLRPV